MLSGTGNSRRLGNSERTDVTGPRDADSLRVAGHPSGIFFVNLYGLLGRANPFIRHA